MVRIFNRYTIGMILIPLLLLAGCSDVNDSFLDPKGPIAAAQKSHFISVTLYSMLAAGPVFLLVPLIMWRYRYKNKAARYAPDWAFSGWLDSLMWGVPVVIVFVLSSELWRSSRALDPYKPIASDQPALQVQVIGLDWKWLFIYPDYGVASIGELAFPVDRPVSLVLTSDTVMQSFMVGSLAGQIYVMPGMQTRLQLKADEPGVFQGQNTQFNGNGFAAQKFNAVALSSGDFDDWLTNVRTQGVELDERIYGYLGNRSTKQEVHEALASASVPDDVTYFSRVTPNLYQSILGRYHAGIAIAPEDQPGGELYRAAPLNSPAPGGSTL